jgi:hypothetical protein
MSPGKHRSSAVPVAPPREPWLDAALCAGAQAAAAAVELERKPVAVLVETVAQPQVVAFIAAAGRSGVEEVYGVLYLDVGCDVGFYVCWVHHFSPLITAIRREP